MINEAELNQIKGLMHYLNHAEREGNADLAFDVQVIDSNGDTLARIERLDDAYQLLFGEGS